MNAASEKQAYSRLETDAELVERVQKQYGWWKPYHATGEALDMMVEWDLGMQRRIIWIYP